MGEDEWVTVARVEDAVVAELLLRLKEVKKPTGFPPAATVKAFTLPKPTFSLEWSVRQRRSKAVMVQTEKQAPRASPTTPLSWSGATSISGGGGGGVVQAEVAAAGLTVVPRRSPAAPSPPPTSVAPNRSHTSRSTVVGTSETPSTTKRSRRKKTLVELKEEDDMLERERRQLKRELASVRLNLEKERAINEILKKMKFDLQVPRPADSGRIVPSELAISDQLQQKIAYFHSIPAVLPPSAMGNPGPLQHLPPHGSSEGKVEVTAGKFELPDLNIPLEENSG